MGKITDHKDYITDLIQKLKGEKLEHLDFDELVLWLDDVNSLINNSSKIVKEYNFLRDDLIARISGMLKAISAVEKNNIKLKDNLLIIDSLKNKDSEDLIHEYQKTIAKFKDTFPASFGYLNSKRVSKSSDWESYK